MAAKHSDEKKAAVLAALLTGQSISQVAKEYKLPEGTIKAWSARERAEPALTSGDRARRVGVLLMDYIEASLRTLKAQVEIFGDEEWIKKQSADEVAILHGVITDKAIRLLEAISVEHGTGADSDLSGIHQEGSAEL